jgi:hypothetical protein
MVYVVLNEKGDILVTQDIKQVDNFLVREDGLYHLISVYGKYVTHEVFQTVNHKIHRIDSMKL